MRTKIFIFFFLIISVSAFSQEGTKEKLIPYRKGAKWGFADTNAKIVIEPKFDSVGFFEENGVALVRTGKNLQMIKPNGEIVFQPDKIKPRGGYYSTSFADEEIEEKLICRNLTPEKKEGEKLTIAVYNKNEDRLIATIECVGIRALRSCDYVAYSVKTDFGYGEDVEVERPLQNIAVYSKYDFSLRFKTKCNRILSDRNIFYVQNEKGWGIVDSTGSVIVPFSYQRIYSIDNGFVAVLENSEIELLDFNGNVKHKISHNNPDSNTYYLVSNYFTDWGQIVGCLNSQGDTVVPVDKHFGVGDRSFVVGAFNTKYHDYQGKNPELVYSHEDRKAFVRVGDSLYPLVNVVDLRPQLTSRYFQGPTDRMILPFEDRFPGVGSAILLYKHDSIKGNRRLVYNRSGKFLFQSELMFSHVFQLSQNCYYAFIYDLRRDYKIQKRYLLNEKGEDILDSDYVLEASYNYLDTLGFQIKYSDKYGFCDTLGNVLIPPIYDILDYYEGHAVVKKDGKMGVLYFSDYKVKELIPLQYKNARYLYNQRLYGANDEKGEHIFSFYGIELFCSKEELEEESSWDAEHYVGFKVYDKNKKFLGYYDLKGNKYFED